MATATRQGTALSIGLDDTTRSEVVKLLQDTLADEYLLYTKTRKFHWNVKGPDFIQLHALFEEQYTELAGVIDAVAERITTLGYAAIGTLAEMLDHGQIQESPGENPSAEGMIAELVRDHETMIRKLREDLETADDLGDTGTNDFLTGLMQQHEKTAWMLRAHLG